MLTLHRSDNAMSPPLVCLPALPFHAPARVRAPALAQAAAPRWDQHCRHAAAPRPCWSWCLLAPWRTVLCIVATVVGLAVLAAVRGATWDAAAGPFPVARWVWLAVWAAAMAWLLWSAAAIVGDVYDDGLSTRVRGLRGLVHVLDVWVAREVVLANLWFLVYVWPPGRSTSSR